MTSVNVSDEELERCLQRGERLLPQLEVDIDGPDAATDRYVLARARAALVAARRATPTRRPPGQRPRWTVPLALAATLVLSFALLLQLDGGRDVGAPTVSTQAESAAGVTARSVPAAGVASAVESLPGAEPSAPPAAAAPAMAAARASSQAADETAAAASAPAMLGAPAASRPAAAQTDRTREEWLARIERLQAAGDVDGARRELAAFREQYPQFALPADLLSLTER